MNKNNSGSNIRKNNKKVIFFMVFFSLIALVGAAFYFDLPSFFNKHKPANQIKPRFLSKQKVYNFYIKNHGKKKGDNIDPEVAAMREEAAVTMLKSIGMDAKVKIFGVGNPDTMEVTSTDDFDFIQESGPEMLMKIKSGFDVEVLLSSPRCSLEAHVIAKHDSTLTEADLPNLKDILLYLVDFRSPIVLGAVAQLGWTQANLLETARYTDALNALESNKVQVIVAEFFDSPRTKIGTFSGPIDETMKFKELFKTNLLIPCKMTAAKNSVPKELKQKFKEKVKAGFKNRVQMATEKYNVDASAFAVEPSLKDIDSLIKKIEWSKIEEISKKIKPLNDESHNTNEHVPDEEQAHSKE